MKTFVCPIALIFSALYAALPLARAATPLALVYAGRGACPEDCVSAAAIVAHDAGFDVKTIGAKEISDKLLARAALYIQPGGESVDIAKAISKSQKESLRRFVKEGGRYVGFCAGAFFADDVIHQTAKLRGLALLSGAKAVSYSPPPRPHAGPGQMLPMKWEGKDRQVYFEEGAAFVLTPQFQGKVVANYEGGEPATIVFNYGKGRVALSGAHPEAPQWWIEEDGAKDSDGSDIPLAVDLVRELFAK